MLGAISDFNARLSTDELVVRALVNVLKTSPTADIKDQQMTEVSLTRLNVADQFSQTVSVLNFQAALALVTISADNRELVKLGIGSDYRRLIFD